jgi:superfamily I DNA/RNA helicase
VEAAEKATAAAQLVEVRESVREVVVPRYVEVEQPARPKPSLFAAMDAETLLSYGVPAEWLEDVRQVTEDTVLELAERLPGEAAEALLELATGGTPKVAVPIAGETDPFEHPDAQRRFRVMTNVEELQRALDYPWERWMVFLHPAQRDLVTRQYGGAARVSGSAGTGKTVVALHRAAFLARKRPEARILLTTFSDALAEALAWKLRRLVGSEPRVRERIEVCSLDCVGRRLCAMRLGEPDLVDDDSLRAMLRDASQHVEEHRFSDRFLWTEWIEVIDAWQLETWEEYRDVARLGRKRRLGEKQRQVLWTIFERVRQRLSEGGLMTSAMMFRAVTEHLAANKTQPYEFVVVDEAQDVGVPQLRFLAELAASGENGLFFAGDLGQRIFQTPFSWKSLGVDVRGRSQTLRVNYRTSHQIRRQADRLLPPELADVDGIVENRQGTVSVFNGTEPVIKVLRHEEEEVAAVAEWLSKRKADGILAHEIGLFVRSAAQLPQARAAVAAAKLEAIELNERFDSQAGRVPIRTMHLAKGLEFRAVIVMACNDEVIPLQERMEAVADEADLEEVYSTERHLLYVACTRARDHLLITAVSPASEFLDDLASTDVV